MSGRVRRPVAFERSLIGTPVAGSIGAMRLYARMGVALALAGSAAGALAACSSTSTGDRAVDASAPDAAAPDAAAIDVGAVDVLVAPTIEAAASDASKGGVDASGASDGGCPSDGAIPDDLACTGLYSDWATKTIAADAVAYTPGLVFWSDGAVKSRWLHLPAGATIDTTDIDNWVFPVGTKVWKQFALAGRIVETRLIWKTSASGWTYLDYLWTADGTAARRFDDGETNVNGTTYEVPSTSVCAQCHAGRADVVLGIDLLGTGVSAAQGVTLAGLVDAGRLSKPPAQTTIVVPEDSTHKAAAALGWLHVNCGSSCHNLAGRATATGLYMKLLAAQIAALDAGPGAVATLDTYTTAVNVMGKVLPGGNTYNRIAPGDAAHSLLPLMALSRDADGGFLPMPPLVSHIPDTTGEAPLSAWINALGDAGP